MNDDYARSLLPLPPHVLELLLALASGPAHGYALIARVREQSGGVVELSTSSLYAALSRMDADGLVEEAGREAESSGGPPRRLYRITSMGRRCARLEMARLRRVLNMAEDRLGRPRFGRSSP